MGFRALIVADSYRILLLETGSRSETCRRATNANIGVNHIQNGRNSTALQLFVEGIEHKITDTRHGS